MQNPPFYNILSKWRRKNTSRFVEVAIAGLVVGAGFTYAHYWYTNTISSDSVLSASASSLSDTKIPVATIIAEPTPTITPSPTITPTPVPLNVITEKADDTVVTNAPSIETHIIGLINTKREANGLTPLQHDRSLTDMADSHARDISSAGLCGHKGSNGLALQSRAIARGVTYTNIGETIACSNSSPDEAVTSWWNSPSHNDILLGVAYTKVGVSWITSSDISKNRAVVILSD